MSKQQRPTSAGYRLPIGNNTDVYQDFSRPEATQTVSGIRRAKEAEKCNEVNQNKIWRERIHGEWKGVKEWDKNWSFMKETDPRGKIKSPEKIDLENHSIYSETVPSTQGHQYGSRVNSEIGEKISKMEFLFHSSNRKCKLDKEFVSY